MFEEIGNQPFPEKECEQQKFWNEQNIFQKSLENRKDSPFFSFYDGPPFATGLPHYGHLLAGTIKDVVPRYMSMKGHYVPRRFGWDCHGLPVENEIEKAKNLSGAKAIEEYGIAKFNEDCRSIVLRYTKEWEETVSRMGRWVDFNHTYHTMDLTFMESVWWVFKQLYDKGLIYEGFKVMPFSAKLGTPLSNFEASDNYKDVDDPSLIVTFPLEEDPNTSLLAWTTTPWTLTSNLAATVGQDLEYVKIEHEERFYILEKTAVKRWFKDEETYQVVETLKGSDLVGKHYKPLFNFFSERREQGAFRIIAGDFVSTEEGTGVVHTAPAFGEDDFYVCKKERIELVCPVDSNGSFTEAVPPFKGMFVKDADKQIARQLKEEGRLFYQRTVRHRYPYCWRSDTPLIYRAMTTWFVAVEKIKEEMLKSNEQIHWTPSHIKEGRFGKWLEGARDWAISRNRYWGTPIPLWRSDDGEIHVIGSVQELEELTSTKIKDLHRHFIDELTFEKNGKTFRRIPEVFDCWFESGSMPYAQNHYPFENKKAVEETFPADFIAEGLDQTRGWFYTLTVLSTALFKKPAFKNVIVNGIILAEDGNKMSKRLRNYPDPQHMIDKYGADAIRLYMLHSNAVKGEDLCFTEKGIELVLRQIMIPFWNAYSFLITYVRIYKWTPSGKKPNPTSEIDRWILSKLQQLNLEVDSGMKEFDLSRAVEPFIGFIGQLTNWYIRRSRRRFWEDEDTPDRQEAFSTLYYVLLEFCKIIAPFMPFISETMYRNLRNEGMPESVHLCDYPRYLSGDRDELLEKGMELVQQIVSLGHAQRKLHKQKVRQPLASIQVALAQLDEEKRQIFEKRKHLIGEELNIKKVILVQNEREFVTLKAKPNFRVLGKKVGKFIPQLQEKISHFTEDDYLSLLEGATVSIELDGECIDLTSEDILVERIVKEGLVAANDHEITIALDLEMTPELKLEGLYREIVHKINAMRREAGFEVTDRIHLIVDGSARVKECFDSFGGAIAKEVLALSIRFDNCEGEKVELNGESAIILLQKHCKTDT